LGVNERYLVRSGLSNAQAGATLALNGGAGIVVHVTALTVSGILVGTAGVGDIHLPRGWPLLVVAVVVFAALGLALGVPGLHRRFVPPLEEAVSSLAAVLRRPRQALLLFGGAAGITASYALAFGFALAAFRAHASPAKVAA